MRVMSRKSDNASIYISLGYLAFVFTLLGIMRLVYSVSVNINSLGIQ